MQMRLFLIILLCVCAFFIKLNKQQEQQNSMQKTNTRPLRQAPNQESFIQYISNHSKCNKQVIIQICNQQNLRIYEAGYKYLYVFSKSKLQNTENVSIYCGFKVFQLQKYSQQLSIEHIIDWLLYLQDVHEKGYIVGYLLPFIFVENGQELVKCLQLARLDNYNEQSAEKYVKNKLSPQHQFDYFKSKSLSRHFGIDINQRDDVITLFYLAIMTGFDTDQLLTHKEDKDFVKFKVNYINSFVEDDQSKELLSILDNQLQRPDLIMDINYNQKVNYEQIIQQLQDFQVGQELQAEQESQVEQELQEYPDTFIFEQISRDLHDNISQSMEYNNIKNCNYYHEVKKTALVALQQAINDFSDKLKTNTKWAQISDKEAQQINHYFIETAKRIDNTDLSSIYSSFDINKSELTRQFVAWRVGQFIEDIVSGTFRGYETEKELQNQQERIDNMRPRNMEEAQYEEIQHRIKLLYTKLRPQSNNRRNNGPRRFKKNKQ